jgi:hypothetical protein
MSHPQKLSPSDWSLLGHICFELNQAIAQLSAAQGELGDKKKLYEEACNRAAFWTERCSALQRAIHHFVGFEQDGQRYSFERTIKELEPILLAYDREYDPPCPSPFDEPSDN